MMPPIFDAKKMLSRNVDENAELHIWAILESVRSCQARPRISNNGFWERKWRKGEICLGLTFDKYRFFRCVSISSTYKESVGPTRSHTFRPKFPSQLLLTQSFPPQSFLSQVYIGISKFCEFILWSFAPIRFNCLSVFSFLSCIQTSMLQDSKYISAGVNGWSDRFSDLDQNPRRSSELAKSTLGTPPPLQAKTRLLWPRVAEVGRLRLG